ncbi:MAG: class I SAM-dependent RNA methyltransferase [Gemmatimonadota bacterium]
MIPTGAIRIERLAAGGDGVGRLPDGRTVFVPRSAPGDVIVPADVRLSKRFARARLGRLLEPGPDRVTPRCRHYVADQCGGCQWQHLSLDAQRAAKRAIIGDALRRLGHLDLPDPDVVPADRAWGYRARVTLAVRAGGRRIGFHVLDRADRVFDLERCEIADPALMDLWAALRVERNLLPDGATALTLRLARAGARHLLIEDQGTEVWSGAPKLAAALERRGVPATIWWRRLEGGGAARVMAGGTEPYPATAFEQVNPSMGDAIRAFAVDRLGAMQGEHVWDLYAGVGDTSRALAQRGATVESVEVDRRAVEYAARASGASSAIVAHAGRAEALVPALRDPSRVITNPPRTGMDQRVMAELVRRRPRRIVYVSCDPATLARDLARLAEGYRVVEVTGFDLFPQTAHVESVAVLEIR